MTYVLKNSAMVAKTKAMTGRLLGQKDYNELIVKKSVGSIAEYLKRTDNYKQLLTNVPVTVHRRELEKILRKTLLTDYLKFFKFINGNFKKFLRAFFLRNEIEDIKILIRMLDFKENRHEILDSLLFLKEYGTVDIERLSGSKNLQDFVSNLQGSKYYKVLYPYLSNPTHLDLFSAEMTLDMYFFTHVWKRIGSLLTGEDKIKCEDFIGSESDILNILWIYRSKKYYNIPKENIYAFLIPIYYRIKKGTLIEMVESTSADQIQKIAQRTKYAEIFSEQAFSKDGRFFEERGFSIYLYRMHKRNLSSNSYSASNIISYLYLRQEEIRNIISIMEGIRYNMPSDDIKKYIIRVPTATQ